MDKNISQGELDQFALDVVQRLMNVVVEQQNQILKYEGAVEGIKLFLTELKKKMDADKEAGNEQKQLQDSSVP